MLSLPCDCGDGLVMRRAGAADADDLIEFNTRIFDERITGWVSDLVSGRHPTVGIEDFTVVEEMATGRIVSSSCLISQTCGYEGIPFPLGRPELVATDPGFRRRGLVRGLFDSLHARSAAKGEMMQVITGVEWFYRQFGYEMGPRMWGSRVLDWIHVPENGGGGGCRLRHADREGDEEFVRNLYEHACGALLYASLRSRGEWDYETGGRSSENTRGRAWLVIEGPDGERLGYVQYLPCIALPHAPMFRIYQAELVAGGSWLNLARPLLRALWDFGLSLFPDRVPGSAGGLQGIELALERDHAFFRAIPRMWVREIPPCPWYVRIPDVIPLLRRIRPRLDRHLVGTAAEGFTGELKLSFYRSGIRLAWDHGQLAGIESWIPEDVKCGDARLPYDAFVRLVCGWVRFEDLAGDMTDCRATDEAALLLDSLFPPFHGKFWLLS